MDLGIRTWAGIYLDSAGNERECVIVQVADMTEDVIDAATGDMIAPPVQYWKIAAKTD